MAKQDYYELLGVGRDSAQDDLKRAYRTLAKECHPDRNPGDAAAEQKFKDISEAYEILSDGEKRAAYDRFGHAAFEQDGGRGASGFDFNFASGFADIFDEMFGDFGGGRRAGGGGGQRGSDLSYNLEISLEEAYGGKDATIRFPLSASCDDCHGSGAAGGSQPSSCISCHGSGKVRAQQGFFTVERSCPTCHGAGQVIEDPCRTCSGAGRVRKDTTLSVTIPGGVEDGTRIRLAGKGEAGLRGAASGDLYIFISVAAHRFFQRDSANIYCRVPISMTTAALGGSVEVPTVDGGRARVNIPTGTQSGDQFRLKNKGMTILRSSALGDMYIQTVVETPMNLTKRQSELLREFDESGDRERTSPESEGFFAKVRELWEDLRD